MPTAVGAWAPNASTNKRMQLIVLWDVPSPGINDTSVTVTGSVIVAARSGFSDSNNTFAWSGSFLGSGSTSKNITVPTDGSTTIHTFSKTVALKTSPQGFSLAFSLSGVEDVGATASVSLTGSVPALYGLPPANMNPLTVTRTSDISHTLHWSATPTAQRPIDGFELERYRGSQGPGFVSASAPLGSARRSVATPSWPNDEHQWRLRAYNSRGKSDWAYSPIVKTTPAKATYLKATSAGNMVDVTWRVNAPFADSQVLQASWTTPQGSNWSSWSNVATMDGDDEARLAIPLTAGRDYRFRIVTRAGSLTSTSSTSNRVGTYTAPAAPTITGRYRLTDGFSFLFSMPTGSTIDHFEVRREVNKVGGVMAAFQELPASTRGWLDKTVQPDSAYKYAIRAVNAAGNSGWTYTDYFYTAPAAATDVKATRSGTSAVLVWKVNAKYGVNQRLVEEVSLDNGVTWGEPTVVANHSLFGSTVTTRTVTGLVNERRYRYYVETLVKNVVDAGPTETWTRSKASNVVATPAPPAPPTLLSPMGVVRAEEGVLFKWQFNSLDASDQTAYILTIKREGYADTVISGTTEQQHGPVTLEVGDYTWNVVTKGQHASYGPPASADGVFFVRAQPVLSIDLPTEDQVLDTNELVVEATAYEPDGNIVAYRWQLYRSDGELVHSGREAGVIPTPLVIPYRLENNTSYYLDMDVLGSSGLWSPKTTRRFSVVYESPIQPILSAEWVNSEGLVRLGIVNPEDPTDAPAAVYNRIERSLDGGANWHVVADQLPLQAGWDDETVPLNVNPVYRAVAVSDWPSETAGEQVSVFTRSRAVWLNGEDGTTRFQVWMDLQIKVSMPADVALEQYWGRKRPIAHFGIEERRVVKVSGTLLGSEIGGYPSLASLSRQHVFYRDPSGVGFWGVLYSGVEWDQELLTHGDVSFTIEEVETDDQGVVVR